MHLGGGFPFQRLNSYVKAYMYRNFVTLLDENIFFRHTLKRPKLEIFVADFFTQSKPVWVDDLGTRKEITFLCLGPSISLLIGEIFV